MTQKSQTAASVHKAEAEHEDTYRPEFVTLSMPGPVVTTEQIAEDIGEEHPDLAFWRARAEW